MCVLSVNNSSKVLLSTKSSTTVLVPVNWIIWLTRTSFLFSIKCIGALSLHYDLERRENGLVSINDLRSCSPLWQQFKKSVLVENCHLENWAGVWLQSLHWQSLRGVLGMHVFWHFVNMYFSSLEKKIPNRFLMSAYFL